MTDEPIDVAVYYALTDNLKTPDIVTSIRIAYPDVAFAPNDGETYLDARSPLRAAPERLGVGYASSIRRRGIFQVDVVLPDGKGTAVGLRVAALVAARFPIGTKLAAGRCRVSLDSEPTIAAAVKDAPWVRYPVSIPFEVIS